MLVMRLQRIGKKGQAYFRMVVTEHTKKPQGEFLELIGSYDPHKKNLIVKKDRIEYWMSKGVQPSPTVNNLLVNHKIIVATKMLSWKPKASIAIKAKADAEAAKAAAAPSADSGQAAPKADTEAPAETPVEEPAVEEVKVEEAPNEDSSNQSQ